MPRKAAPSISVAEFAADHAVTPMTIRNWMDAGMPYREVNGQRRIVRAKANPWVRAAQREAESPDEAKERARKLRYEADLKHLELEQRRQLVVPKADYERRLEVFIGGFKAAAAGRLTRFERAIIRATTPGDARRVTEDIHMALMEGALQFADELEAAGDPSQ